MEHDKRNFKQIYYSLTMLQDLLLRNPVVEV